MAAVKQFSAKQKTAMTWWANPKYKEYDAIICDGAVRSGKTLSMGMGFFLWAMRRFTVLPLSSDIYLEVDGKKVAVVQSYTTRATRTSREIEAFGENEPVATIAGANKYTLELSRLYATDEAISDGINFYDLNDFSLVICKPDKRIIYSQCRWSSIEEAGKLGDPAAEKVTIIARKRMEIAS